MRRVGRPTATVPHLVGGIRRDLPDIDKDDGRGKWKTKQRRKSHPVCAVPLLPMAQLRAPPSTTTPKGELQHVGEKDGRHSQLQGVERLLETDVNLVIGKSEEIAHKDGPTSGANQSGDRDPHGADGATVGGPWSLGLIGESLSRGWTSVHAIVHFGHRRRILRHVSKTRPR